MIFKSMVVLLSLLAVSSIERHCVQHGLVDSGLKTWCKGPGVIRRDDHDHITGQRPNILGITIPIQLERTFYKIP